jgi:hypothetical protein
MGVGDAGGVEISCVMPLGRQLVVHPIEFLRASVKELDGVGAVAQINDALLDLLILIGDGADGGEEPAVAQGALVDVVDPWPLVKQEKRLAVEAVAVGVPRGAPIVLGADGEECRVGQVLPLSSLLSPLAKEATRWTWPWADSAEVASIVSVESESSQKVSNHAPPLSSSAPRRMSWFPPPTATRMSAPGPPSRASSPAPPNSESLELSPSIWSLPPSP